MQATSHTGVGGFDRQLISEALDSALSLPGPVPVFAISGLQGSGKSTFAAQLAALGQARGLRVAVLSIDDFYLSVAERERLAADVHPLLRTRGPPGTHDLGLALSTLDGLRDGGRVALPRFDKLADERAAPDRWPTMHGCDLVVLEGWFLKTPAQAPAELAAPLNALERDEDRDGRWRWWCNEALDRDYPPLWRRIDALWLLQAPGFGVVPQWRWEQEQALLASGGAHGGMDLDGVARFVQLFERVSRQALETLPAIAERTVPLDAARRPAG